MRRTFTLLLLLIYSHSGIAALVGQSLSDTSDIGLVSYSNVYTDGFSSDQDAFQIFDLSLGMPDLEQFVDRTNEGRSDALGLVDSTLSSNDNIFVASDTVNSDNPTETLNASWVFDVSGFDSFSLSLDLAAMGDFERSDQFSFSYAFDNQVATTLWHSVVDEAGSRDYRMSSGNLVTLNDPLSLGSLALSNEFSSLSADLLGQGSLLTIMFSAKTDGGSEVFAFSNMQVHGESSPVVGVPEPGPSFLFVLAAGLMFMRRRASL